MPSPKYASRKPRSRPDPSNRALPSFASTAELQSFIAPDVDGITDLFDVTLFFSRPLGPVPFDEPSLIIKDQTGGVMTIDSSGYGYDPITAEPNQLNVLMIRVNGTGHRVASLKYNPPGYVFGQQDGSGVPLQITMNVTTMTFSP